VDRKRVLFISGSIGLGHIGRDLAIAQALCKLDSRVEISWLAEDPASMVLVQAGENLLPEARLLAHANAKLDNAAKNYRANLASMVAKMGKEWKGNTQVVAKLLEKEHFDLVVGDETYELAIEVSGNPEFKRFPFVMIFDCVGADSVSHGPVDSIMTYMVNRIWAKAMQAKPPTAADRSLFIGEPEDIPDKKFGFMLPNRRQLAVETLDFVGYILPFNPPDYVDKPNVRKALGYDDGPLIVCSIGGTSAGKDLLSLCAKTYPLIKEKLAGLRMVLVCGPLLKPDWIQAPEGVEVRGYMPELYKHLAASDLCIVTGGGTVTLELTALRKPFLYFPLKKHFEQEGAVAYRCKRHGAGVRMDYEKTSPQVLARVVLENFGKEVHYTDIPTDGAKKAAQLIQQVLNKAI